MFLGSTCMSSQSPTTLSREFGPASGWIKRWMHLLPCGATVLDIACGHGRHMKWFAENGHRVTGVDRSAQAIDAANKFGTAVLADIENDPWPLHRDGQVQQFDAVVVSNYLWRPLFPTIAQSLAPGGILIYETFSQGNETVGKPSRPDFLLNPSELLLAFSALRVIAFEEGFLENPARFVQRIVAARPDAGSTSTLTPRRNALDLPHSR
jgi:SAM-dependent methyltransferase